MDFWHLVRSIGLGAIPLEHAPKEIVSDWIAAYRKYVTGGRSWMAILEPLPFFTKP
jgi:hypothetical protein